MQEAVEGVVEAADGAVVGIEDLLGDLAVEAGGGLGYDLGVFLLADGGQTSSGSVG